MENESEVFKVMWRSVLDNKIRFFAFTHFEDDKVNRLYKFIHDDIEKVLTINYDDVAHMITEPYV